MSLRKENLNPDRDYSQEDKACYFRNDPPAGFVYNPGSENY